MHLYLLIHPYPNPSTNGRSDMQRYFMTALLWAFTLTAGAVEAPQPHSPAQTVKRPPPASKPVLLDGEALFEVRGIKSLTATRRAEAIAERIQRLADDPYLNLDDITVATDDISADVLAKDRIILSVFGLDVAAEGITRQERATHLASILRSALLRYRKAHSYERLASGVVFTVLATLALGLFLRYFNRFYAWLEGVLSRAIKRWVRPTQMQLLEFIIEGLLAGTVKILRLVILIGVIYLYVTLILGLFPWTRTVANRLFTYVTEPLQHIVLGLWSSLPNLMFLLVLLVIVTHVLKLLRFFFTEVGQGRLTLAGFYPEWAMPTYKIVWFLTMAFTVVIAYPYLPGSDSPAFRGISLFLGVLFSLGSTSIIANIVAGVILTYMRGFRVGDIVKIGEATGRVTEVTMLVTRLRTIKNVDVTIPNSVLMGSQVTNYSFAAGEGRLILPTCVTIGYDTPWRQVHALLLLAAERTQHILREPAPFVLQTALDDFYVKYELNVYVVAPNRMPMIMSELHQNIQDAFNEFGVQIMSPHYVLDPKSAKIVEPGDWVRAPASAASQQAEPSSDPPA